MHKVHRYHDISCGHRVVGHESKCRFLHGHNYRIHFTCVAEGLDSVGRVIDFSVIKSTLCEWLENEWDHKMLIWEEDDMFRIDKEDGTFALPFNDWLVESIVWVPFNPTAENMAMHLVIAVGPALLKDTGVRLEKVVVEETRKCSAEFADRRKHRR